MPRKSLLVSMEITEAGRAHDCRYNKKHRILKGDRRLTVKVDRDEHNYCLVCAKTFIEDSYSRLGKIKDDVASLTATPGSATAGGA